MPHLSQLAQTLLAVAEDDPKRLVTAVGTDEVKAAQELLASKYARFHSSGRRGPRMTVEVVAP